MGTSWSSSRGPSTADERVERLEPYSDPEVVKANLRIFEELKADPKFSEFFSFTFPDMKVGRKIAGGHIFADMFEGEFTLMQRKVPCELKIFKYGLGLDLSKQFPDGMLTGGSAVFPGFSSGASSVLGGLILEDGVYAGSFAFVLRRVWGNLEDLIDLRMSKHLKQPPFGDTCAKKMMLEIAIVMQQLHKHSILHRFLTPYNVMVCTNTPPSLLANGIEDDAFHLNVFDFENTVGLINISYPLMPPEIYRQWQECNMQPRSNRHFDGIAYTNKSDVYSYALTCHAILTGDRPSRHLRLHEMDLVVNGSLRPKLPERMDKWLRDLIEKCWHSDPLQRPEFEEIVQVFKSKVLDPTTHAVEQEVEASKSHWSQICHSHGQDDLTNHQVFENLKQHPEFSNFFSYTFRNLKQGPKIAEGGQAKIFEGEFEKENGVKVPCVVKLFKHISFRDMVRQWPPGMLQSGDSPGHLRFGFLGLLRGATRTCEVLGAMVDEDDNFAFIFNREGGDLRRLIEHRMRQPGTKSRPFKLEFAKKVMYEIALGMQHLHDRGILHRDLKASNMLVTNVFGEFPSDANDELIDFKVADFECSMLVEGTRFWRAPEILKQSKSQTARTYTRESDVYSYGMTCYEVLTGGIPLEHLKKNDYAAVYVRGERPVLPDHIDGWLKRLVERCWHSKPSQRPEFKEIVEKFEKYCPMFQS